MRGQKTPLTKSETVEGGDDLIIGESSSAPAARIHSIVHGGDCDVYIERTDRDGTVTESVLIDSFTDSGISQNNSIEINRRAGMRLRIVNTSDGPADYIVTGITLP